VYHAGEWLLPLLAFWLQDWRLLNLAIAAICCITGALVLPIPESPRWLLLKGRQHEARSALSWLARLNGRQLPEGLDITNAVELTPAASASESSDSAGVCVTAGAGAACMQDASSGSDSSLQEDGTAVVGGSGTAAEAFELGPFAAPLAARPISSSRSQSHWRSSCDVNSKSTLLDDDCAALLPDDAAPAEKPGKQEKQQQQEKQRADAQQSTSMLALFSHALLARYFVVASLLCTVMAICFYTINLATDSLQVRVCNEVLQSGCVSLWLMVADVMLAVLHACPDHVSIRTNPAKSCLNHDCLLHLLLQCRVRCTQTSSSPQ
jgi:hypothetical protein